MSQHRVRRTVVQVAASVLAVVTTAVAVFPAVAPEIVEALEPVLPDAWYAWLVGAVASVTAIAGAIARIMRIPAVDRWLTKLRLGTEPTTIGA